MAPSRKSPPGRNPLRRLFSPPVDAAADTGKPRVAIIVSGLGINQNGTLNAITKLPDAVTLAFAPYGKTLARTVAAARDGGHEIFLEVPLEPFDYPDNDPGPDTLLTGQAPRDNLNKLFHVMSRFGGYVGLINNMGARFTASGADFGPMMEELGARGLGYVDDGSSNRSLAPQLADANRVPFGKVDQTLDANPSRGAILDRAESTRGLRPQQGFGHRHHFGPAGLHRYHRRMGQRPRCRRRRAGPRQCPDEGSLVKPVRETMPYRDCVGTAVFNAEGLVLIGRRKPEDDPEDTSETNAPWQMPQGGIDKGEAPARHRLPRTLRGNLDPLGGTDRRGADWIYYDLPDEALGIALKGKYRGQRQRWFAFRFTGDDSEINVTNPGGGEHPAEFDRGAGRRSKSSPT